jgi:hypothetical protein
LQSSFFFFLRYGEEYASEGIRKYFKKVKNAQEAHEAIRPTSIRRLPCNEIYLHFFTNYCVLLITDAALHLATSFHYLKKI